MTVTEFIDHLGEKIEKFVTRHIVSYPRGIPFMHFIPINIFLTEKTVMLVNDTPQCLKITTWIVGIFRYIVAR